MYITTYYTFVIIIHIGSPERLSSSALHNIINGYLRGSMKEVRTFFICTCFVLIIKIYTF